MGTIVRHCRVQRNIHYFYPKINRGQVRFAPGDDILVAETDFGNMSRRRKIKALDLPPEEITEKSLDLTDIFPRRGQRIWVFGDGPTAGMSKKKIEANDVVFGVNRCFLSRKKDKTPALGLVPDYYVALDEHTVLSQKKEIQELQVARKFLSSRNAKIVDLPWSNIRLFDIPGEDGFSIDPLVCYHGKTSAYCALQLAVQCGLAFYPSEAIEIHLAGIDLGLLTRADGTYESHHYGTGNFNSAIFPRMLAAFRYGLNFLNEIGVSWVNHSSLLQGKIEDLVI